MRPPRNCDLPEHVLDDRIRRYMGDEPLRVIAGDHGVTIAAICLTVRRHAPCAYGKRARGPKPRA